MHRPIAAGARALSSSTDGDHKATNIVWSELLAPAVRQELSNAAPRLNHKGACVWLTGLSGSGKSTVGAALEVELIKQGMRVSQLNPGPAQLKALT